MSGKCAEWVNKRELLINWPLWTNLGNFTHLTTLSTFSLSPLWLSSLLPTHPLFDYLAASHSLSEPTVVPLVFPESYHFLPRTTHLNQNFFSNDNPSLQRSNLFTISLGLSSTKLLIVLGRLLNDFVTYTIIVWPFLAISPRGSCNFSRKVGWYG